MNVKDSPLYKSLCKSVRKEDHAELLRMLEMVPIERWLHRHTLHLWRAFHWDTTPQGWAYWSELQYRLRAAGHNF